MIGFGVSKTFVIYSTVFFSMHTFGSDDDDLKEELYTLKQELWPMKLNTLRLNAIENTLWPIKEDQPWLLTNTDDLPVKVTAIELAQGLFYDTFYLERPQSFIRGMEKWGFRPNDGEWIFYVNRDEKYDDGSLLLEELTVYAKLRKLFREKNITSVSVPDTKPERAKFGWLFTLVPSPETSAGRKIRPGMFVHCIEADSQIMGKFANGVIRLHWLSEKDLRFHDLEKIQQWFSTQVDVKKDHFRSGLQMLATILNDFDIKGQYLGNIQIIVKDDGSIVIIDPKLYEEKDLTILAIEGINIILSKIGGE